MKKYSLFLISFIIFTISFNLLLSAKDEYVKLKVLSISKNTNIKKFQYNLEKIENVKGKILSGKLKNKIVTLQNYIWKHPQSFYNIPAKKGDTVIAHINFFDNQINGYIAFQYRSNKVLLVILIFFLIIILLTKKNGLRIILSLILIYILLFFCYIPLVKIGFPPILLSIIFSLVGTFFTLYLILKNNIKLIAALGGIFIGLISVYFVTYLSYYFTHITALTTYAGRTLNMIANNSNNISITNISYIFIAGVIIASLGALMDIAVDSAAALYEIKKANPDFNFYKLMKHGLNVSRNIVGTMVNTLIFATLAGIIILLLDFYIMKTPFVRYSNMEFFLILLIPAFASSIGLIITSPATILIESLILNYKKFEKYLKITLPIFTFLLILFLNIKIYGWISPPDKEMYRHPITKMYLYRNKELYALGKVIKIKKIKNFEDFKVQYLDMKINVKNLPKIITVKNFLWGNPNDIFLKKGGKAIVWIQMNKDRKKIKRAMVIDRYRFYIIYYLTILLFTLLILFGGKRSIWVILSLIFSIAILIFLYIPLIARGYPIIFTTILINFLILLAIILALSHNKKMFIAAFLSAALGGIIIYISSFLIGYLLKINGSSIESIQMLNYFNYNFNHNLISNINIIIYSIVLFGATGALSDVSISISTALNEIIITNPRVTRKELYYHGISIGRDISGTMVNTLILAYTGLNLAKILVWLTSSTGALHLLNLEFLSVELTKSIAGSIGFLSIIPVVSYICSIIYTDKKT